MRTATLNLNVLSKRLLTKSESAFHCGRSVKRFLIECHVTPVKFPNGDERYDIHDLDGWLDSLKHANGDPEIDAIVARLD